MALREGNTYRAVITGYTTDGDGVARVEGMAVFVKGALRGEDAEFTVEHVGRAAAWAHADRILTPSPARQEPDCPYYRQCGGCQFRHMTYAEELEAKRQRVQDALAGIDRPQGRRRIGGHRRPPGGERLDGGLPHPRL